MRIRRSRKIHIATVHSRFAGISFVLGYRTASEEICGLDAAPSLELAPTLFFLSQQQRM
jgi:hypothetical protein